MSNIDILFNLIFNFFYNMFVGLSQGIRHSFSGINKTLWSLDFQVDCVQQVLVLLIIYRP